MNRTFLFKNFFQWPSQECVFHRSYAIMSRAKFRAGIPTVKPIVKSTKSSKTSKQQISHVQKHNRDQLPLSASTLSSQTQLDDPNRIPLPQKPRFPKIRVRKPAGIDKRLVKVPKAVVQPEDPHLLKVALIGAANAGKSTIVNKLIGEEVSGVSPKAHTTRERVLAILSEDKYQIVFLDTPGVIPDNNHAKMNRTLATSSWRSLDEAEHIMVVVDAQRAIQPQARKTEEFILKQLENKSIPATLIFNKMDLLDKDQHLLKEVEIRYYNGYLHFKRTLNTAAISSDGLEDVKTILFKESKAKPWVFPADQKTEMSDLKRVEEIIRIEFFKRLHQYLPYMLKQENVGWTELKNGTLRIDQNVYVQRDSQQKIVIGHNGRIIDTVIEQARQQISEAFKRPVKLFIQVKTSKNRIIAKE